MNLKIINLIDIIYINYFLAHITWMSENSGVGLHKLHCIEMLNGVADTVKDVLTKPALDVTPMTIHTFIKWLECFTYVLRH
jgi:hypothetical protein